MGFLSLKAVCAVCNKEVGLNRYQIANKEWICPECFKKCGFNALTPIRSMTIDSIKSAMESKKENENQLSVFNTTKKIFTLEIDENQKKWLVCDGAFGKKKNPKIYSYSDIIDFELLEDGETITKGGLGRAVVGGALLGGVGAVVGGVTGKRKNKAICNSLKMKITVNDMQNPALFINFITTATKKDGMVYKSIYRNAQLCLSTLQIICNNQETHEEKNDIAVTSSADEILKFKNLLDNGIITQDEFEAKKKQLLGL